jgi:hypothetical protein
MDKPILYLPLIRTELKQSTSIFFLWRYSQNEAYVVSLLRFLDHAELDAHNRHDSSDRVISPSHRQLHMQQTQQTNIHALREIRIRDPGNRAAADLCLRPQGQRHRLTTPITVY